MFITLEGPEGSGKTTQARLLVEYLLRKGYPTILAREPGGTAIGDQIRAILHDPVNREMDPWAEVFLYAASRAQLVAQVIQPALAAGRIVVCDRFYDSTLAYQGYGRGLSLEILWKITRVATRSLVPDLTLYLDIQPAQGLQRRLLGGEEWNRLDQETLEFHQRVRAGYLELASLEPERWVVINAVRPVEEVQREIQAIVEARLNVSRYPPAA